MIIDSTSHEEHMRELAAYEKKKKKRSLCYDCDFKYVVFEKYGRIEYCPVRDIYEDRMDYVRKCEHYRVENKKR